MYELIVLLLQPPLLLGLLVVVGLGGLWRKAKEGRRWRWLVTIGFVLLCLVCMPAVNHLAVGSLEWHYPPLKTRPADIEAIVVLACGMRIIDPATGEAELDADTIYRCLHAADLYHQGEPCPVLVSGGKVDPDLAGPPPAHLMRDFLVQLGVKERDLIVEDTSRTTYENAVESARLLRKLEYNRLALVTDAVDLFRAVRCFEKQGFQVVPAGCHYRSGVFELTIGSFIPSPAAAQGGLRAWHEWLGVVWYWINGRL